MSEEKTLNDYLNNCFRAIESIKTLDIVKSEEIGHTVLSDGNYVTCTKNLVTGLLPTNSTVMSTNQQITKFLEQKAEELKKNRETENELRGCLIMLGYQYEKQRQH